MKRLCKIGYVYTEETSPGVWTEQTVEKNACADITEDYRKLSNPNKSNYDVDINLRFSILSTAFASLHYLDIRYVEFDGRKLLVTSATPAYPRINLTVGGLYNGNAS